MPVYEYHCTKCGHRFEQRRSMSQSDRDINCPRCGTPAPRRVFSLFATGGASGQGGNCAPSGGG